METLVPYKKLSECHGQTLVASYFDCVNVVLKFEDCFAFFEAQEGQYDNITEIEPNEGDRYALFKAEVLTAEEHDRIGDEIKERLIVEKEKAQRQVYESLKKKFEGT